MKYFKDSNGKIFAYELDGSQDHLIGDKIQITEDVYNSLPASSAETYNLPAGDVVVTVETNAVSLYDYELNLNESKRNIKLLNSVYVNQIETEYQKLMSA